MLYGEQHTWNFKVLLEYLEKSKILTIELTTFVSHPTIYKALF